MIFSLNHSDAGLLLRAAAGIERGKEEGGAGGAGSDVSAKLGEAGERQRRIFRRRPGYFPLHINILI